MDTHQHTKTSNFSSKLEERIVFFFVAIGVVTLTLGFLVLIDFVPESPTEESSALPMEGATEYEDVAQVAPVSTEAQPIKIFIDSLDREVAILNPASNTVEALDTALLSGVVRHPDSADLVNEGTIFLLGHSSYLPTVNNKNFQAFNGIQKLVWGDTIRLHSGDMEYVYSVDRVYEAKASSAEIPLQFDVPKLVLATCNSFGTKDDRFIVEATLVSKQRIAG